MAILSDLLALTSYFSEFNVVYQAKYHS